MKAHWKYCGARLKQIFTADVQELEKIENPHRLKILCCGIKTGMYIADYNFIRIILETQRDDHDLFLKNMRALDYVIFSLMIVNWYYFNIICPMDSCYKMKKRRMII